MVVIMQNFLAKAKPSEGSKWKLSFIVPIDSANIKHSNCRNASIKI